MIDANGEFDYISGTETVAQTRHEIAFVDVQVEDYQQIIDDLTRQNTDQRHIEVVLLDASCDGIDEIGEVLQGRHDIDAVHIFSHGIDGAFELGDAWLNAYSMEARADAIGQWGAALSEHADILLYGCDVAADGEGQLFVPGPIIPPPVTEIDPEEIDLTTAEDGGVEQSPDVATTAGDAVATQSVAELPSEPAPEVLDQTNRLETQRVQLPKIRSTLHAPEKFNIRPGSTEICQGVPTLINASLDMPQAAKGDITAVLDYSGMGDVNERSFLTVETGVQVSGLMVSVGFVTWALRATGLLSTLLASIPAWRSLDPLSVLKEEEEDKRKQGGWTKVARRCTTKPLSAICGHPVIAMS